MLSIVEAIRQRATPESLALVQKDRSLTYAALFQQADALAADIRQHLPADLPAPVRTDRLRIGVHFPSSLEYVPLALATLLAGGCFVPIPDELADEEKRELATRTALDLVLVAEPLATWLPEATQPLGHLTLAGQKILLQRLPPIIPSFPTADFEALNPAFIRFSSGTTGKSKGVLLSHESLLERITAANEGLRIGAADRVLWVLPMAHHFAVSIILYLYHGATTLIEETHMGEDLLRAGATHAATVMYGSPVHYRQLVEAPPVAEWTTLRLAVATAAALDAATAEKFRARFHQDLVQGLGIIELGLPVLNLAGAQEAPEAIGLPLSAYECSLQDDTGHEPPQGDPGEICLRGKGMFDAYLDPWLPRAQALDANGWFPTGDLGRRDPAGRVTICGRKKTLINVGGMKVFPEEVERVLDSHPKVQRSLVEARLHPLYGEVPIVRYIPSPEGPPTTMELRNHCRTHLAGYKIPLLFSSVPDLPLTASGKLKRA
ncbi:long-chain acyl-CoA synthetase [Prosthecobacter fusiformis]|uniref:Long-chain acyl-CoA synthetase n=1 Tax=Prosthecobacter fusiformis TaxID=48464 RepID=A0A4R7RJM2_9BACT|nr:class I adenylate-forming enzyme family protein [Prosthecobacter fusiformis]TDU62579.1 long-chain acyl-CoA synthetase [Prosthecobacter fusiformis]